MCFCVSVRLPGIPTSARLTRTTARMTHCCVCGCWIAAASVHHAGPLAVSAHTLRWVFACARLLMRASLSVSFLLCRFILFPLMQWLIFRSEVSLDCAMMSESLYHFVVFLFVPSVLLGISFCRQYEGLRPPVPVTPAPWLIRQCCSIAIAVLVFMTSSFAWGR